MIKDIIKKYKQYIIAIILTLSILIILVNVFDVIKWYISNNETYNQIDNINNIADIKENDDKNAEIINNYNKDNDPYWKYIKMKLIDVNFDELNKLNSDTKAWVQVSGTNINYPVVKANNNDYYLNHSYNKSENEAGWVFFDYRNNIMDLNKNTIIYAHGRVDTTMFGSLKNILSSNWYSDLDNHIIRVSTQNKNYLWQVFSVYRIKTTSDYLQIDFDNNNEYQSFLNTLANRSAFKFNTSVNYNDKIITLSTCYNDSDKVVMHAKLIKIQNKS